MSSQSKAPRISSYLYISGRDFDPQACSAFIGLQPTEIWRQKREELKQREDLPNVSWNIGHEPIEGYSVSDAVDEVLDLVWPARERLRTFLQGQNIEVGIACTVAIHADRPIYDLSASTIRRLAELSCKFTLDVIDYTE